MIKAKIKKKFPLKIDEWVWDFIEDISKEMAYARTTINALTGTYAEGSEGYRENEDAVSEKGMLGELLHKAYRYQKGYEPGRIQWLPQIQKEPVIGADAIIDHRNVDAKCTEMHYTRKFDGAQIKKNRLQVNAAAHDNASKSVDEYFFVFTDSKSKTADVYVVDHTDVNSWEETVYRTATLEAEIPNHIYVEDYWDDED